MNAIVSGRSRRALIIEEKSLKSFEVDDPSRVVSRQQSDLPYLFGEARDLRILENTSIEVVERELRDDCDFTLALDLTLISLDSELPDDIRKGALEGLNEFFTNNNTLEQVENVLYSEPLPDDADVQRALELCASGTVHEFLRRLKEYQPKISHISHLWEVIPTKRFENYENRDEVKASAVRAGLFRFLVIGDFTSLSSSDRALLASFIQQGSEYDHVSQEADALCQFPEREDFANEARLREELLSPTGFAQLIGTSEAFERTLEQARSVAATNVTVLLSGESGTGKGMLAGVIHQESLRGSGPFVAVNCATLPETLIESELFGHEKGAFPSATQSRKGRFELADGGTLFLDEIGGLSAAVQVKLLRVLQEGKLERVGGTKTKTVDVRLIAATSRDLENEVAQGRFRQDLYFRLNVVPLQLPPLRERSEDIPLLAAHFAAKLAQRCKRRTPELEPALVEVLLDYDWPGNVRQLENVIERLIVLSDTSTLGVEFLPELMLGVLPRRTAGDKNTFEGALKAMERRMIESALQAEGYNKVAKRLGISKSYLHKLINEM